MVDYPLDRLRLGGSCRPRGVRAAGSLWGCAVSLVHEGLLTACALGRSRLLDKSAAALREDRLLGPPEIRHEPRPGSGVSNLSRFVIWKHSHLTSPALTSSGRTRHAPRYALTVLSHAPHRLSAQRPGAWAGMSKWGDNGAVSDAPAPVATRPRGLPGVAVASAVLIAIVLTFAVIRVTTDWPHILDGTVPDDDFAKRFVAHPWLGYLHIVPGVIYLLGAPLQLARRFRTKHYTVHRRLGRALLSCALLSGVLALVLGCSTPGAAGSRPAPPWSSASGSSPAWYSRSARSAATTCHSTGDG